MVDRAQLDDTIADAAQGRGERGLAGLPVRRVTDHEDVADQLVVVLLDQATEARRTDLLLALDEQRHAHGRLAVEGPQGGQVHRDTGLVVIGATGIQTTIADGRLEGRGGPQRHVAGRLDVMVRVQADRRLAFRRREVRDDGRVTALGDDLHVRATQLDQQRRDLLGTAAHLVGLLGQGTHRLDADQVLEVLVGARQDRLDAGTEGGFIDAHGASLARALHRQRGPRVGQLELPGQAQQDVVLAEGAGEHHADGQLAALDDLAMQRQADRRTAGEVGGAGPGVNSAWCQKSRSGSSSCRSSPTRAGG